MCAWYRAWMPPICILDHAENRRYVDLHERENTFYVLWTSERANIRSNEPTSERSNMIYWPWGNQCSWIHRIQSGPTSKRSITATRLCAQNCPLKESKKSIQNTKKTPKWPPNSCLETTWEPKNKRWLPGSEKNRISASGYIQEYTKRAPNLISGRLRDDSKWSF